MDPNVLKWAVDNGFTHEDVGSAEGRAKVQAAYNRAHGIGTRTKEKKHVRVLLWAENKEGETVLHDLGQIENRSKGIDAAVQMFLMANGYPFDRSAMSKVRYFVGEERSPELAPLSPKS